ELDYVAVAGEELEAEVDGFDLEVGPEVLGLRRVHRGVLTVVEGQCAAVDECFEGVDAGLEFGEFEASVLEVADRLTEGGAFEDVLEIGSAAWRGGDAAQVH